MSCVFLAASLLLDGCTKRSTVQAPAVDLPSYEQDLVGLTYGSASFGDWTIRLDFERDAVGLTAVLTRVDDGLAVEFDVRSEFFPFSAFLPSYLVLTPQEPWVWTPYSSATSASYAPILLDCLLYTGGGTFWPPSGFDNYSQVNPVATFLFYRVF